MAHTSKNATSWVNKDTRNTQNFSLKIREILDTRNLPGDIDTSFLKKQVLDVLWWDTQKAIVLLEKDAEMFEYLPKDLQKDPDILTLMVQKKPDRYDSLPQKLQQDPKIQRIVLSSTIATWDMYQFLAIIIKYPKDKKLRELAESILIENPAFLAQWYNALIYDIFKNEKKIYDLIFSKWLLEISQNWVSLWSSLTSRLQKILSDLEWSTPEQSRDKIFTALLGFLWIKQSQLWEASLQFVDKLVMSFSITQKTVEEEDNTSWDEMPEEEDIAQWQDLDVPPSIGPYYYSSIWNTSRVLDPDGTSILIDSKTFESMSEKSLENFMNFSKLMKQLWLSFLLEKQERRIQLATQINFYEGEWMSLARILKFLNSIGKNVWVPEKSYKNQDGEARVWCFDTLWAAKHKFREISESQQLWDINLAGVSTWAKWVVEVYMKSVWLLTEPFGEISIAKWK